MIKRLLRAAIGLSLFAASLASDIEDSLASSTSICIFCDSCFACIFNAVNLAKNPKAIGSILVNRVSIYFYSSVVSTQEVVSSSQTYFNPSVG